MIEYSAGEEYRCLGSWEDSSTTFAYVERVGDGVKGCFASKVERSGRLSLAWTGQNCERSFDFYAPPAPASGSLPTLLQLQRIGLASQILPHLHQLHHSSSLVQTVVKTHPRLWGRAQKNLCPERRSTGLNRTQHPKNRDDFRRLHNLARFPTTGSHPHPQLRLPA